MTEGTTREELLALFAVSSLGVCAMGSDGRFMFWNRSAERITGLAASQVLGRRRDEIIAPAANTPAGDRSCWEGLEGRGGSVAPRPVEATLRGGSGEETQVTLVPVIFASEPHDDALTLWMLDASAATEAPESDSPAATEPHPDTPGAGERQPAAASPHSLSPREVELLRLIAAGTSTERIASDLAISIHTVRNHVRSLRHKLGAKTKLEAVVIAIRNGLL